MENDGDKNNKKAELKRIADALERIADAMEAGVVQAGDGGSTPPPDPPGGGG